MEDTNKRSHFRVELSIPINWKVLDDKETEKVRNGHGTTLFKQSGISSPIEEYLEQTAPGTKDEQFFSALQFLNNKLDFIIEQMTHGSKKENYNRGHITELSAEGLKFESVEKAETGSLVMIELLMPGVVHFCMELIAEILRVDETENQKIYAMSAHIACIMEDARDSIVKMLFQKQRIEIRNKTFHEEGTA